MWKNALALSLKKEKRHLFVTIKNPQPHNIPTGFGGRELLVEVQYFRLGKRLEKKVVSLTTHYTRKRGRVSIPHTALKQSKNLSVPAKGKKILRLPLPPDASSVKVTLFYRLANDEIAKLLHLQEPLWHKKFYITSKKIKL
jgi:hypothetical protein